MTARDQVGAVRDRRLAERDRAGVIGAVPAPRLGEVLLAARERKGVDLYRAERDTKIRAKYLAALERSDFRDLPGAVYTKGFLRNYALYLGLDPELILAQWKNEVGGTRPLEPAISIAPPPRPIEAPRSGFKLTPGLLVAAVLTVGVVVFLGYIGFQVFRFSQPPELSMAGIPAVSTVNGDEFRLAGTTDPGATVTIQAPGQQVFRVTADASGRWERMVPLNKGRNDFEVIATDPSTTKVSKPVNLIVNVPLPTGPEAPTLTVTSPNQGTSFTNGAIPVRGTTTATRVRVTAAYAGAVPAGSMAAGGQARRSRPPNPAPKEIAVRENGSFSDSYQVAPGRWSLTLTATSEQQKTTTETRTISVAFTGVNLVIDVKNKPAWIKVWVDGEPAPGYEAGRTLSEGTTVEFNAKTTVRVRTGSAGNTFFTLNGNSLGSFGRESVPQTWLFQPPNPPKQQ